MWWCAAWSQLSYISGGGDKWIWGNGGMMISRGKLQKLGEISAAVSLHKSWVSHEVTQLQMQGSMVGILEDSVNSWFIFIEYCKTIVPTTHPLLHSVYRIYWNQRGPVDSEFDTWSDLWTHLLTHSLKLSAQSNVKLCDCSEYQLPL
jgi:hypothetical protein